MVTNLTVKTLVFKLSQRDIDLAEEITLTGVISSKMAKGEYDEDPEFQTLLSAYESCHEVNAKLHSKLNRVRRALSHPELQTENPEDELD